MGKYPADFIDADSLENYAALLFRAAVDAVEKAEQDVFRNVIDPFSAVVDSLTQHVSLDIWLKSESSRQAQKTLQNAIGTFHQNVLGSLPGWENAGIGGSIDVRNNDLGIVAEIKNKYNTMNSGAALAVYDKLSKHIDYNDNYRGRFVAYVVYIIPRRPDPFNDTFNPSDRGTRRPEREDVRQIDGRSFYEMATGNSEALKNLYLSLPLLAKNRFDWDGDNVSKSKLFEELFFKAYKS